MSISNILTSGGDATYKDINCAKVVCNNLTSGAAGISGGLTLTTGNLSITTGDILVNQGNQTISVGNLLISAGDLTLTNGGLTLTNGDANFVGGAVNVINGNLTAAAGTIEAVLGDVIADAGDLKALNGGVEAQTYIAYNKEDKTISNSGLTTTAVAFRQGFIKITRDVAFPNGTAITFSMTGPFFGSDLVLVCLGGNDDAGGNSALLAGSLEIAVKSVSTGTVEITIANTGTVAYAGTDFSFTYMAF